MSDVTTPGTGLMVRASDADREQTVSLLQRSFAEGRLTQAELEERASAACQARTTGQLDDLITDLPADEQPPSRPGMTLDRDLLIILLCVNPLVGLIYWLLTRRRTRPPAGPERAVIG